MNVYVKSDLYRCYGKTGFGTFIKEMLEDPSFNYMFWLRMCQAGGARKLFALPIHKWKRTFGKINIGYKCKIGYGLYIGHGGPCIVSDSTIIGNNCNLSQFVTIGTNEGKAADIGDNVYIGPGVCVVEHVSIGSNVTIGAGSVVVKNIPDNATAVGNPAHVVGYKEPGKYIKHQWLEKRNTNG